MKITVIATIIAAAAAGVSANPFPPRRVPKVNVDVTKNTLTIKCGNGQAIFCCDKFANCKTVGGSAGTSCNGGITTCCEQNANKDSLQVCLGSVNIGGDGTINISN